MSVVAARRHTRVSRESGSDGARALQMGSIGHVGGCREAPYDKR
jgi:hypothetical protein